MALEPANAPTQLVLTALGSEKPLIVQLQRDDTCQERASLSLKEADIAPGSVVGY